MKKKNIALVFSVLLAATFAGSEVHASRRRSTPPKNNNSSGSRVQKVVYVHGFQTWVWKNAETLSCQNKRDCNYWSRDGKKQDKASNRVHVGWASAEGWPFTGPARMLSVLNRHCKTRYCAVVCHSTGCPVTEYVLDHWGQHYKIEFVSAHGSAEGGTGLAVVGSIVHQVIPFLTGTGSYFLIPSVTRRAYDHNDTKGKKIYMKAGTKGSFASIFIRGEDDGVVPVASACGYNVDFRANKCSGERKWCPVWYNPFRTCSVGKYRNRSTHINHIDHSQTLEYSRQKTK